LKDNTKWKVYRDKWAVEIGAHKKIGRPIRQKRARNELAIDLMVEREVEHIVSAEKAKITYPTTNCVGYGAGRVRHGDPQQARPMLGTVTPITMR
jgi:hypothetical protein